MISRRDTASGFSSRLDDSRTHELNHLLKLQVVGVNPGELRLKTSAYLESTCSNRSSMGGDVIPTGWATIPGHTCLPQWQIQVILLQANEPGQLTFTAVGISSLITT